MGRRVWQNGFLSGPPYEYNIWKRSSPKMLYNVGVVIFSLAAFLIRIKLYEDETLAQISQFKYLEHLNLYGTEVTDAGLSYLYGINSLRSLYLWQTHVTIEGAELFRSENP